MFHPYDHFAACCVPLNNYLNYRNGCLYLVRPLDKTPMEHCYHTLEDVTTEEPYTLIKQLAVKGEADESVDQHQQQAEEHDPQQRGACNEKHLFYFFIFLFFYIFLFQQLNFFFFFFFFFSQQLYFFQSFFQSFLYRYTNQTYSLVSLCFPVILHQRNIAG